MPPENQCFDRAGQQVRWSPGAQAIVPCATPEPNPTAPNPTTPNPTPPNPQPNPVVTDAASPQPVTNTAGNSTTPNPTVTHLQPTPPAQPNQPLQPGVGHPGSSSYVPPQQSTSWLDTPWPWVLAVGVLGNIALLAARRILARGNTSHTTPVGQRQGGPNVDHRTPEQRAREQRLLAVEHLIEDVRPEMRAQPLEARLSFRDWVIEQWETGDRELRRDAREINADFIRRVGEHYDRLTENQLRSRHAIDREDPLRRRRGR